MVSFTLTILFFLVEIKGLTSSFIYVYKRDSGFDDRIIVDNTSSIIKIDVLTEMHCGIYCNNNSSCLSFLYEDKAKKCVMNSQKIVKEGGTRSKEEVVVYRKVEEITKICLEAICQVEGCDPTDCYDNEGCGFYHLTKPFYLDCGKPGTDLKSCGANRTCSDHCMRTYMSLYGTECVQKGTPTCEDYARIHYDGPLGCRTTSSNNHWQMVRKQLWRLLKT